MKILCVDDDAVARTLYTKRLGPMMPDDSITVVGSGEEAINEVEDQYFEVIITDLIMPGLSGLDVLKYAQDNSMVTEVIIVTGAASVGSAIDALKHGARDYIEKPLDIPLLKEKLENIRDYQSIVFEAEELRMAKEITEAGAEKEVKRLEKRINEMQTAITHTLTAFDDMSETAKSKKIKKALKNIEVFRRRDSK